MITDHEQSLRELFGERMRQFRTRRNLTQSAAARAARISRQAWNMIENGEQNPTLDTVERIAVSLDVHPAALVSPPVRV